MSDYKKIKTKWLTFTLVPLNRRKTQYWMVSSKNESQLGGIEWCNRWRCYVLYTIEPAMYSSECLNDIKKFIDGLMDKRKKK